MSSTPSNRGLQIFLMSAQINKHKKQGKADQGFTLAELMIVIVIVGILSAVAIPQFMRQTKKAVATEAVSQSSAITKLAAAYNLETPIKNADETCAAYMETARTGNKFTYSCSGSASEFVVTASGTTGENSEGIKVVQSSNLESGAIGKPVISGI
jgi:type IV pilus assembly protein PilA